MIFLILAAIGYTWFIIPVIGGLHNIGSLAGCCLFGFMFLYGAFRKKLKKLEKHRWYICFKRTLIGILCACLVFGGLEAFLIAKAALNHPKSNEEVTVVVLGCKVNGEQPSKMLSQRINAAFDYLQNNPRAVCIVTGGKGADEEISEAECMQNILIHKGIAPERILTENQSTSTKENLVFAAKLIENNRLSKNIVIVTHEFHQYRAYTVAKKAGLSATAVNAETDPLLFPTYLFREFFGILGEWIR